MKNPDGRTQGMLNERVGAIKYALQKRQEWQFVTMIHFGLVSPLLQEFYNESRNIGKKIRMPDIDGREIYINAKEGDSYVVYGKNGEVLDIDGYKPSKTFKANNMGKKPGR